MYACAYIYIYTYIHTYIHICGSCEPLDVYDARAQQSWCAKGVQSRA